MLEEVPAGQRRLFGEEGDVQGADGGFEGGGRGRRGFGTVVLRHGVLFCPLKEDALRCAGPVFALDVLSCFAAVLEVVAEFPLCS